jgi:hypothetical protein
MHGLKVSGAVMVWLALAILLIWAGFTGRLPAVLGAIIAPGQMDTGKDRAATLTTEAGTHQTEATGSGAFSDNAETTLILAEDWH